MRHDQPILHTGSYLDLASNDYLRMSRHPAVIAAASQALKDWGTGARSSRVVTGTYPVHHSFERSLSAYLHAPTALVFSSGYTANLAAITTFVTDNSVLICDVRNHASLIDACRLAGIDKHIIDVDDVGELQKALRSCKNQVPVVVCDAVDSVTGKILNIPAIYELTTAAGGMLITDNAHGLGVWGATGSGPFPELYGSTLYRESQNLIVTCTLSKALGAQGGAIVCSEHQRSILVNRARTFIFDTALSPAMAAATTTSLQIICEKPHIISQLHRVAKDLQDSLGAAGVDNTQCASAASSPIIYIPVGSPDKARFTAKKLKKQGILVGCFTPPSVQWRASGVRLTLHPHLTTEHIEYVTQAIATALDSD